MSKSILILSNKSSGSSAVQRLLAQAAHLKCVEKTRHYENESLYWVKAASILKRPQQNMLDSEVPIPQAAARQDLIQLLSDNLPNYTPPNDDRTLIFEGWRHLCDRYEPVFLEKSPHHLLQWSALELIVECMERLENQVDFLLVGLVRNPLDTLYSAFRRWKTPPEALQYEWLKAYSNLRLLAEQVGDRLVIVRYEDLATSLAPLDPVFKFCGTPPAPDARCLNRKSLLKWQEDPYFAFLLAPEVIELAQDYGYTTAQLTNSPWRFWPQYRDLARSAHQSTRWAKTLYFQMKLSKR